MRNYSLFAAFLIGCATIGFIFSFVGQDSEKEVVMADCDPLEETRVKIALQQCSDLVLYYTWDDLEKDDAGR